MLRVDLLSRNPNGDIEIESHASQIKEVRDLLKVKEPLKWLAWVWYMEDPRSSYAPILREERSKEILQALELTGRIPKEATALSERLQSMKTSAQRLLEASRASVAQLTQWLETVDPEDEDYDVSKHLKVLSDVGKVVNSLTELEKAVEKEMAPSETYGGAELTEFNS